MSREKNPSATYAASGLSPKMTNGHVHQRTRSTSINHMQVASVTAPMPAVNSTKELVHRFLLIGKTQFHIRPTTMSIAPTPNNATMRSRDRKSLAIHCPAITPSTHVDRKSTRLNSSHPSNSYAV